jgi:S1-C subfamily serine protease
MIPLKGVIKYDVNNDLALIAPDEELNLTPLTINEVKVDGMWGNVITAGSKDGNRNIFSGGYIQSYLLRNYTLEDNPVHMFNISNPIGKCTNGGPLFNIFGELIGVTTSNPTNEGVNYAISIIHAKEWINKYVSLLANEIYSTIPFNYVSIEKNSDYSGSYR